MIHTDLRQQFIDARVLRPGTPLPLLTALVRPPGGPVLRLDAAGRRVAALACRGQSPATNDPRDLALLVLVSERRERAARQQARLLASETGDPLADETGEPIAEERA